MIARNAPAITAIAAVLTLLVLAIVPAVGGLYWLIQLNGKVDYLQAELEDTQQDIGGLRQEVNDVRREVHDVRQEVHDVRQEVHDVRQEVNDLRQEVQDTRRKLLIAIEQSEQRILDALANHTHDEEGNAVFTRPVRASARSESRPSLPDG